MDQYNNDANWRAHFETTGPEIVAAAPAPVTHFVATVGTGGTFTGVGRYLKGVDQSVTLVELQPDSPFHGLEGLKHMETAIVPKIWDSDLADTRLGVPTEASYDWVRHLAAAGILIGPSGGAAVGAVGSRRASIAVWSSPSCGLRLGTSQTDTREVKSTRYPQAEVGKLHAHAEAGYPRGRGHPHRTRRRVN